jgi:GntR family transcriptional regulator
VQQHTISELTSFSEELRRRGKQPGGMLFISELVRGSQAVREELRLTDEEQVVRLERVRTADNVAVAYEIVYLPYPRAAGVYQRAKEIADGSLYLLLASEGLQPYIAEQVFKAGTANEREGELLNLPVGEIGLRFLSTTFDETGIPIEYSEAFLPANRYDFHLTLRVTR